MTLEDIANHWMLPILGDLSPSGIKLYTEEKKVAVTLRGYSSTRIIGWPALFLHHEDVSVCCAPFIVYWLYKCIFGNSPYYTVNNLYIPLAVKISTGCFYPLAPMFLGHLYSQLDLLHDCEVERDSCHILLAAFNTTVLHTFLWEYFVNSSLLQRIKRLRGVNFMIYSSSFWIAFQIFETICRLSTVGLV